MSRCGQQHYMICKAISLNNNLVSVCASINITDIGMYVLHWKSARIDVVTLKQPGTLTTKTQVYNNLLLSIEKVIGSNKDTKQTNG